MERACACCYHSVKDNKSESKSQLARDLISAHNCCYHSVKDNKSESKSQQTVKNFHRRRSCYHSVKDNKSESKSQPTPEMSLTVCGCYHSVKDNKSESKSQLISTQVFRFLVVIILSKIINLKANHNYGYRTLGQVLVVIILSNDNKSESKSQPHYVKWQHTNTAMDKVVI